MPSTLFLPSIYLVRARARGLWITFLRRGYFTQPSRRDFGGIEGRQGRRPDFMSLVGSDPAEGGQAVNPGPRKGDRAEGGVPG